MISHSTRRLLIAKLEKHEKRIPHLYLDSLGKVTVGVGHMMPAVSGAKALAFMKSDRTRATPQDVELDWNAVVQQGRLRGFNHRASSYSKYTKLRLPDTEIDRLTSNHLANFERSLGQEYAGFYKFPIEAQLALFDMIFNLGASGLRTKFPKFNKAIRQRNWKEAASESNRPQLGVERNRDIRDLFLKAEEKAGKNNVL